MSDCDLSVKNLSILAGERKILWNVDFDLPGGSITALMGPMGSGKSTFLKFLAGETQPDGLEAHCDAALYRGSTLGTAGYPRYIKQKTREVSKSPEHSHSLMQQRLNEVVSATKGNSDALCIDEPTAGLSGDDGNALMESLAETAGDRSVLIVSHNTEEVRRFCDHVVLFGGGRILCNSSKNEFFESEQGSLAEHFLRTGGLDLPSLGTPAQMLSSAHRPMPTEFDTRPAKKGGGPTWIIDGALELRALRQEAAPLSEDFDFRDGNHRVIDIDRNQVTVLDRTGVLRELNWKGGFRQPHRDKSIVADICREIEGALAEGRTITINSPHNLAGAAAVVGSFMVLRGCSPEDATALASIKVPDLHFGLRLEQLFWDIDVEFGLTG